jgi:thiol-disulfide isomerase/thioredoxin
MQKKWVSALVLVIAGFAVFYYYNKYKVAPEISLKDVAIVDLNGSPADLASYKGEKILLCFAASWCGPCRQELGLISSVKQSLLSDVHVVVVSDEPVDKVLAFKNDFANTFDWMRMIRPFSSIGINSIPSSYLINRKGEVVKKTVGFIDWSDPSTANHLSKLMN